MAARGYRICQKDRRPAPLAVGGRRPTCRHRGQPADGSFGLPDAYEAIGELHGVPGTKDRRKELRHRLVDVQAGIADEMSGFAILLTLRSWRDRSNCRCSILRCATSCLRFAALSRSPDPAVLEQEARDTIGEHPLSSLFGGSHHDREGKVVHTRARAPALAMVQTLLLSSARSPRAKNSSTHRRSCGRDCASDHCQRTLHRR